MTNHSSVHGRGDDDPEPARPHPRWQDLGVVHITLPPRPAGSTGPADPPAEDRPPRQRRVLSGPSPDPDRYAEVAPLVSTVIAGPMLALGGFLALGSGLVTDACTEDGCQALDQALIFAPCLVAVGFLALLTSWALPRHLQGARGLAAFFAPVFALVALLLYFNLPAAT